MAMQGKIKFSFNPAEEGKAIATGKRRYFPHDIFLHTIV
jgi:metal-dependent amidase/aminoacylase/carboxypeptidase family protein